jgi:hypothetical protein
MNLTISVVEQNGLVCQVGRSTKTLKKSAMKAIGPEMGTHVP